MLTPELTCTRGLPGSGKSTWAKSLPNTLRSNRDDLRFSMFGRYVGLSYEQENLITEVQRAQAAAALRSGMNVVVDDMHLRPKYLKEWNTFAVEHGAVFRVCEFDTPIDECKRRDRFRDRTVGMNVIQGMADKYMPKGRFLPYQPFQDWSDIYPVVKWEPVTFDPVLEHTVIVDIDGTMTTGPKDRSPYDLTKVSQDEPRRAVVNLVNRLLRDGYRVFFLSGREDTNDGQVRLDTIAWLDKHLVWKHRNQWTLHMRNHGDHRKDDIVKYELFNQNVRGQFNVKFVLDDRPQVIRMWAALGLPVFDVDPTSGEF